MSSQPVADSLPTLMSFAASPYRTIGPPLVTSSALQGAPGRVPPSTCSTVCNTAEPCSYPVPILYGGRRAAYDSRSEHIEAAPTAHRDFLPGDLSQGYV
ncbi:hypothetical protein OC844_003941, partial [Tilletia horrida]